MNICSCKEMECTHELLVLALSSLTVLWTWEVKLSQLTTTMNICSCKEMEAHTACITIQFRLALL